MQERLTLGIDAGGTRTRVAIVSGSGCVLGRGASGPGNWVDNGSAGVSSSVATALEEAWEHVGFDPRPVDSACAGIAGLGGAVGSETQARDVVATVSGAPPSMVRIESDVFVAHMGAFPGGTGVVVVIGTGSICLGMAEGLDPVRVGGWGPVIGDEGSGYDVARRALRLAMMAQDGMQEATSLDLAVMKTIGATDASGILQLVDPGSRPEVAKVARTVIECAEEQDPVALGILDEAAAALAPSIAAALRQLDAPGCRVRLTGGLSKSELYAGKLAHHTQAILPEAEFSDAEMEPVLGAAQAGLGLLGLDPAIRVETD